MEKKNPHSVFQELLARHLAGELSPAEEQLFQEALQKDEALQKELKESRRIWDSSDSLGARGKYDVDAEWELLKVELPGFGESRSPILPLMRIVSRVAAVLLVGLMVGAGVYYVQRAVQTTVIVAENKTLEHRLKDGSLIILNRNSQIRYKTALDGSHRWVKLRGEAWFEVARDTIKPFVVDVGDARVEVLGTRFNVNAYRENPVVEITVESGMVALSGSSGSEQQIILRAGNGGRFDHHSKELELIPQQHPNTLSWKTRDLFFENTPLGEVLELVNHVYGVDVQLSDGTIASCPLTVSFSGQTLESVLQVIVLTLDLEMDKSGTRILLSGGSCDQ